MFRATIGYPIRLYKKIRYAGQDMAKVALQSSATRNDMASHPDEQYYALQYLHWILPRLEERFPQKKIRVIDLGCGQGRLSMPVAEWNQGGLVTGVDFTAKAIEAAQRYSGEKSITNARFTVGDITSTLREIPSQSYDCIIFTEVIYVLPSFEEALEHIHRIMKPGGLAFISFRSKYFNMLHMIQHQNLTIAKLVATQQSGSLDNSKVQFSWHTKDEIIKLLNKTGFRDTICVGIGIFSGREDDPLAAIARPSTLSAGNQSKLFDIEVQLAAMYADCGRYILATAIKD